MQKTRVYLAVILAVVLVRRAFSRLITYDFPNLDIPGYNQSLQPRHLRTMVKPEQV